MKTTSTLFLGFVFFIISACSEKGSDKDFVIPGNNPATALTIGWYVSDDILQEIVGPDFEPKIVNDKNESTIMLYVVKSSEHIVDGFNSGIMEAAHLIIPVESSTRLKILNGSEISNKMICPVTIVDESQRLGNKYKDFGFATYTGEIDFNHRNTGEKHMVDVKIKTANGLIGITAMFEEEGTNNEFASIIYNSSQEVPACFYGEERVTRISNGKGNLKTEGQNMISAMLLDSHPYYLKLDLDISWEFDFEKE